MISSVFDDPDFTFFASREFFLSIRPACDTKLRVETLKVPSSTEDKRFQHEQRLRVKQIAAGFKQETAFGKEMLKLNKSSWTEVPAMELHMFPKSPLDLESQWQALLVPKALQLFGKTVYLCQPQPQRLAPKSLGRGRCVAKATFEQLPLRLRRFWGGWDPNEDPLRSVPHKLLFGMELFMLLALVVASCAAALFFVKYVYLAIKRGNVEYDEASNGAPNRAQSMEKLLQEPLPKSYKLLRHAEVFQDSQCEGPAVEVLDAAREILVLEVMCSEGRRRGVLDCARRMIFTATPEVWGRLDDPKGWILLSEDSTGVMGVLGASDRAPYRANARLMVPIDLLFRRQLVLATSHASAQWLLLESCLGLLPVSILLVIAASLTAMHVLVLGQAFSTVKWGIWCDEVLEQRRQRLQPGKSHAARYFLVCLAAMVLAIFPAAAVAWSLPSTLYLAMLAAVCLHAWDLRASLQGLSKWREPELASEFTEYPSEKLPSSDAVPSSLTRKREPWRMMMMIIILATIVKRRYHHDDYHDHHSSTAF